MDNDNPLSFVLGFIKDMGCKVSWLKIQGTSIKVHLPLQSLGYWVGTVSNSENLFYIIVYQ